MVYAGFWRRFGAYLLDFLILIPIMAFAIWGQSKSQFFQVYYLLPGMLVSVFYSIYLVKRYGGTPGKLLAGIKIAKLDGSAIDWRGAIVRHSVLFVLATASSLALALGSFEANEAEYFSLDWQQQSLYLSSLAPKWNLYVTWAINIWIWGEFLVLLTNEKRRAIHDFMAGTVVIHRSPPNRSNQQDSSDTGAAV
jgi:uncharacterized RDD family membrane protein YckC